eukprot:gene18364-20211_t
MTPFTLKFSSRVLLLEKPKGEFRFCVDYRRLNATTKKNALPRIDETLDALENAAWFSTLNLQSGFWQIPMKASDMEKTVFATQHGHWEFRVMLFSFANAPATFQELMDLVLSGLHWTHCLVYLDDIIVIATTEEEHLRRLYLVLEIIESFRSATLINSTSNMASEKAGRGNESRPVFVLILDSTLSKYIY